MAEDVPLPLAREPVGATIRRLREAQKSSVGAPAYSRFVNRPLGRIIAAFSFRAGLTPNGVTAISAAFSLTAIALLALISPSAWMGVVTAACLIIGYAFDSADGQLARLRGGGSTAGEWLDHMVDATKISALHLAVLVSLYRYFDLGSAGWLLIPIGFVIVSNTTFFGMILTEQLRRDKGVSKPVDAPASLIRAILVVPTDYGLLCLIFVLLGAHTAFITCYTVLFAGNVVFTVKWIKWFRDMQQLDANIVATPGQQLH